LRIRNHHRIHSHPKPQVTNQPQNNCCR